MTMFAFFSIKGTRTSSTDTDPLVSSGQAPTPEQETGRIVIDTTHGTIYSFNFGPFSLGAAPVTPKSNSYPFSDGSAEYSAGMITATSKTGTFVGCTGGSIEGTQTSPTQDPNIKHNDGYQGVFELLYEIPIILSVGGTELL